MKNFETYKEYSVKDWLDDVDFILWVKKRNGEDTHFFNEMLLRGDAVAENMQQAKKVLQSILGSGKELSDIEKYQMWQNIAKQTTQQGIKWKNPFVRIGSVASIVAICCVVTMLWIFRHNNDFQHFAQFLSVDSLQEIQLVLPDKKQVELSNLAEVKLNTKGDVEINLPKGDHITFEINDSDKNMCQLIVPGGKRAYLVLRDGTRVSVHPGSKVVFPIQFESNRRRVYLEGEAFLDVTKNPKKPFFVQTKQMEVSVLGTSFNVMAYPKQNIQSVVLVTGHVKVKSDNGEERRIEPNQCYTFDKNALVDKIETVSTEEYTSWKDGVLNFSSEPLSLILEKISNYYNVKLHYDAMKVSSIKLSGKLDLNNSIDGTLKVLATAAPIEIKNVNSQISVNINSK